MMQQPSPGGIAALRSTMGPSPTMQTGHSMLPHGRPDFGRSPPAPPAQVPPPAPGVQPNKYQAVDDAMARLASAGRPQQPNPGAMMPFGQPGMMPQPPQPYGQPPTGTQPFGQMPQPPYGQMQPPTGMQPFGQPPQQSWAPQGWAPPQKMGIAGLSPQAGFMGRMAGQMPQFNFGSMTAPTGYTPQTGGI